jgi:hypothetical protein
MRVVVFPGVVLRRCTERGAAAFRLPQNG